MGMQRHFAMPGQFYFTSAEYQYLERCQHFTLTFTLSFSGIASFPATISTKSLLIRISFQKSDSVEVN